MPHDKDKEKIEFEQIFPNPIPEKVLEKDEDEDKDKLLELRDLFGMVRTLTVAPTHTPKKFSEQIIIAVAGGNNSLYVYDTTNNKWRAATLGT